MIRPEYAALAGELSVIAADFGHDVDIWLRHDIARLAATMECIDRHVDDVADDVSRRALWADIVALLTRGEGEGELEGRHTGVRVDPELARSVLDVREVATRRGVLPRMLRLVREEIATSEAMRQAVRSGDYVAAVLREGHLTAGLTLLVVGPACGRPFRRFFYRLGGPANLVDKLLDARADHARGELRLSPGLGLYLRLAASIVVRMPMLLAAHPRWWRVIGLGVRYLVVPSTSLGTAA